MLERRQHSQALASLQRIRLGQFRLLADRERSQCHWLFAWAYWGLGQHQRALRKVSVALRLSRSGGHHELIARQKRLLSLVYEALGERTSATQALNESFAYWLAAGEFDKAYAPLVNFGLAHFQSGSLLRALEELDRALEYAAEYNGPAEVRACQRNRSRVLIFLGRFGEAESVLREGEDIDAETGPPAKAFMLQSLGMIRVFQLRSGDAHQYLGQALELHKKQDDVRNQVICEEYLGLNEYFASNYAEAKKHYRRILDREELYVAAPAQTYRLLAEDLLAEGDIEQAAETAKKAEVAIAKSGEEIERGALLRIWGQIHALRGKTEQALDDLQESINVLNATGCRPELAQSYLACARMSQLLYNEQQRRHFLQAGERLYNEMGVVGWEQLKKADPTDFRQRNAEVQTLRSSSRLKFRVPLLGKELSIRHFYYIALPVLAASVLTAFVSITFFEASATNLAVFLGSGILAYESGVLVNAVRKKEREKSFER